MTLSLVELRLEALEPMLRHFLLPPICFRNANFFIFERDNRTPTPASYISKRIITLNQVQWAAHASAHKLLLYLRAAVPE